MAEHPSGERRPISKAPHSVYRIYDATGTLIYVGYTSRGHKRQQEHVNSKAWAWQISRTEWEHFRTRTEALDRETKLIRTKHPKHNKMHAVEGEAEVTEFALMAEQRDVLLAIHNRAQRLSGEIKTLHDMFQGQTNVLLEISRRLLKAIREGNQVSKADLLKMEKLANGVEELTRRSLDKTGGKRPGKAA